MKRRLCLLPLLLLAGCATRTAADAGCYADRVQTSPGIYLATASGRIFQVYPTDNQTSMMWRPLDRLVICPTGGAGVSIVNTTEKGQTVKAVQLNLFTQAAPARRGPALS